MCTECIKSVCNQVSAQFTIILMEKFSHESDVSRDSGLSITVESLQLQFGGHEQVHGLGISGRASST
jgi:hypothetical protein